MLSSPALSKHMTDKRCSARSAVLFSCSFVQSFAQYPLPCTICAGRSTSTIVGSCRRSLARKNEGRERNFKVVLILRIKNQNKPVVIPLFRDFSTTHLQSFIRDLSSTIFPWFIYDLLTIYQRFIRDLSCTIYPQFLCDLFIIHLPFSYDLSTIPHQLVSDALRLDYNSNYMKWNWFQSLLIEMV